MEGLVGGGLHSAYNMAIIAMLVAPRMRSVNIADLKNRLSTYLDKVRAGEEILVRDRNRPIAKIVPLSLDDLDEEERELVAAGQFRPAERPLPASFWSMPAPRVSANRVAAALRWARGER